jgi:hypothetical protein
MSICAALIVFISLFVLCRPLPATWTGEGTCASPSALAILSYFVSAASLVTDLVCAILPGFMLYKAQMKTATKISISLVLGMGALYVKPLRFRGSLSETNYEQCIDSHDHTNALYEVLLSSRKGLSM